MSANASKEPVLTLSASIRLELRYPSEDSKPISTRAQLRGEVSPTRSDVLASSNFPATLCSWRCNQFNDSDAEIEICELDAENIEDIEH